MAKENIEIISGVGDYPSLYAACDAGANAIYFGVKGLNMRDFGKNFTIKDLPRVIEYCHERKIKAYLAMNTIVYDKELPLVKKILKAAKKAKIDAVICSDFLVFQEAKKLRIPIHISTQMSISNSESAEFLRKLGAKRVVLARELNLEQIKEIRKKSKIELEIFIHGSLCIAESGRCFMSLYFHDKSANRGNVQTLVEEFGI
jgi:putative protease